MSDGRSREKQRGVEDASRPEPRVLRVAEPGKRTLTEQAYPHRAVRARQAGGAASAAPDDVAAAAVRDRGAGASLPGEVRERVESFLGVDLGDVRVHTGPDAAAAAAAMGARAFTFGRDVFLGEREQATDLRLMAHELTHVVQQGGASLRAQRKVSVGSEGTPDEQAADEVAELVTAGHEDGLDEMAADDGWAAAGSVTGLVQLKRDRGTGSRSTARRHPRARWTARRVRQVQAQLKRLGLYAGAVDGVRGPLTSSGLVEAFGGYAWGSMAPATILARLRAASPPAGKPGEHRLRYGEMFHDGVLDITYGIGFDEYGAHQSLLKWAHQALHARGFGLDHQAAQALYEKAGRKMPDHAFGRFYVKRNAIHYKPPAGPERGIDVVVRVLYSGDHGDKGAQAAQAFRAGMVESDIAYHNGHGRYGSGPDYDRNFWFELLNEHGGVTRKIMEYEDLESELEEEGRRASPHRTAWQQFLWRHEHHRIRVHGTNDGNVLLNAEGLHTSEFGGALIYWSLQRRKRAVTGAQGELARRQAEHPERRYRVLGFVGCRTDDYLPALRATPGFDEHSADVFSTDETLLWGDKWFASFLDPILNMRTAEGIAWRLDKACDGETAGRQVHAHGIKDNPRIV